MAENSKIEWTTHTFNPWIGCQKVSPGCDHCYAEAMSNRYRWTEWGPHGERKRTSAANWRKPLAWAKAARGASERPRVFCASLADVFDNQVPEAWRSDLFDLIDETPELDWLLLTKRPENAYRMILRSIGVRDWPWRNIWLGTTAEDRAHYDRRWARLREIPARVRFISYEPAIGPLNRPHDWDMSGPKPDWIICGGESGPGARMMDAKWARDVRDACERSGIAFFMKQMTGKKPIPADLMVRQFPTPRPA